MKYFMAALLLILAGCDNFSISGHTYRQYEDVCEQFGGLKRAYFSLGDNNKVILKELVCNNGVTLKYDYVKERFKPESVGG